MRVKRSISALALLLAGCAPSISFAEIATAPSPLATADPTVWPAAASPAEITSPATEKSIDAILSQMTVEQKVGQLIQADISAITPEDLNRYPLGSILAGGNSGPFGDERASADKWKQLVDAFRDVSRKSGAGIPILFGVDAVHGHSNLPGATIFPHNIGLGAARDPDLIRRIGAATAAEIAASGIEWTFAPTLAAPQDVRWGRSYEGYSSDPALIAGYAKAMTIGLQGELAAGKPLAADRVAATAKHFLADGGTVDGRDQGDARISETELVAVHAQGYPVSIDAGALTVMASFSSWNGIKHHGNRSLLSDVLKGRMGFNGLVVGDWNGHGQVAGCSATDCPAAINAGLDLYMAPDSWKGLYESTLAAAREGRIPAARIDDAVRRILRVKFKLGLMGDQLIERGDVSKVGADAHLALAREAVAKSLVLLKNNKGTLPVRKGARVLIAGPGADNMAMQAGGWTVTWQGTDTKAEDFPKGQTIGRAITEAVAANGGKAEIVADGSFSTKPDVAIVVMGEKPYAEFEGDIPHLAFTPQKGEIELIEKLKAKNIRVVVLFLSGRPLFTGKLINLADAFVAGWLPGSQGQGVADVLVAGANGKAARDFTGKLPFAWPADARSPISQPLFPLGYGLNYASKSRLGRVNESPGIDISGSEGATLFMLRGKVRAPWHLGLDGAIASRAIDIGAQEDARQFSWSDKAAFSISGPVVNLERQLRDNAVLAIDWRIDSYAGQSVRFSFNGATLDLSAAIKSLATGTADQTKIPLRCFAEAGAKFDAVGLPLRMESTPGFAASFRTVRVEAGGAELPCPAR
ncbi:glycoside hydrolase family 3 N-terminal domain-containing protein [Sphingorhabdus sp.]|uniref:glycoside hydrolase family 3 protein n=1 Tax=Sphingorhabdus sp. TaxID=1902408 RepID=UPI002CE26F27|nr:glycoside hydrolase family 3 N-terminal domain-containing protein [Sphingorhabdus sp.]HMT42612.1 glycoside hydrolase family 3 N-terminal domain-containing protein [Sphingorhabdus sp.]